jgi:hypothetical protein
LRVKQRTRAPSGAPYGFSNGEEKNRAPSLHLLPDRAAAELDRLLGE